MSAQIIQFPTRPKRLKEPELPAHWDARIRVRYMAAIASGVNQAQARALCEALSGPAHKRHPEPPTAA